MATIFNTWPDQGEDSAYPFEDGAELSPTGAPSVVGVFRDAMLYGAVAITKITVTGAVVRLALDSAASGEWDKSGSARSIRLLTPAGLPGGVLTLTDRGGDILRAWPAGEFEVEFPVVLTCRVPAMGGGLRSIKADGVEFRGDVHLVGEQGVRLQQSGNRVLVDIVGDPRAKNKFCELGTILGVPTITTINGQTPDPLGRYLLLVVPTQVQSPSLQILDDDHSITIGRR